MRTSLSLSLAVLAFSAFTAAAQSAPKPSAANAHPAKTHAAAPLTIAPTPPMGWASWNRYFCDYDEQTIRDQADALVATGMRDLGYKYLIIQECIAPGRDEAGNLVVDAKRFPHGMKPLAIEVPDRAFLKAVHTKAGANVLMPNFTPLAYKKLYEIYPGKRCVTEPTGACGFCMEGLARSIGRTIDSTRGDTRKHRVPSPGA